MSLTKVLPRVVTGLLLGSAAFVLQAQAQTAAPAAPAADQVAPANGPAERAENSVKRGAHAVKRGAKHAGKATKHVANKSAAAVRRTGNKIGSKLPPSPHPTGLNAEGQPAVPKN